MTEAELAIGAAAWSTGRLLADGVTFAVSAAGFYLLWVLLGRRKVSNRQAE